MPYIIKQTEVSGETLYAEVEYTLADGSVIAVRVANFRPEGMEEIIRNVEQRGVSEQSRIDAEKLNLELASQLNGLIHAQPSDPPVTE